MQLGYNLTKLQNALSFQVTHLSSVLTNYLRAVNEGQGYFASNGWIITVGDNSSPEILAKQREIRLPKLFGNDGTRPCNLWKISTRRRDAVIKAVDHALQALMAEIVTDDGIVYEPIDRLYPPVDKLYVPLNCLYPPVHGLSASKDHRVNSYTV